MPRDPLLGPDEGEPRKDPLLGPDQDDEPNEDPLLGPDEGDQTRGQTPIDRSSSPDQDEEDTAATVVQRPEEGRTG